ncbi:VOC family protein [Catenuloplanes japonicus]|uniref:VOC family protein n=1 Tax=Catenuloplanes japonicus TaxID=33876 RepID=UPI000525438B|nr:VOC family protein [Catenuloplanes japonicus]
MLAWVTAYLDRPADRLREAVAFWESVTGAMAVPQPLPQFVGLRPVAGDVTVMLQGIDDGPGGVHLDLAVADVSAFCARARATGATETEDHGSWRVLRSPAGLRFCVDTADGRGVRPKPAEGVLLDQVSLDVGPAAYDPELAFWTALTGWSPRPTSLPELRRLVPPPGSPVQLLLQRCATEQPAAAHADLACADIPAVRVRHEALGAAFVAEFPGWTVMRDPVGAVYCLTSRPPV